MKELHHIVPVCMGGLDDPENKISLSPTSHAIISVIQSEHYQRPCIHPRQLKFLPKELLELGKYWVLLAGEMGRNSRIRKTKDCPEYAKRIRETYSRNCKRATKARLKKLKTDEWFRFRMSSVCDLASEAALSQEARAKRIATFRRNNHQKGSKNSQYGTMWITDGISNKKIKRGEPIPEGFRAGRTI
jgi:hypothetical protein